MTGMITTCRKNVSLLMALILCLSLLTPLSAAAEAAEDGDGGTGGNETAVSVTAVSPAFQEKSFSDLNAAGKLEKSAGMEKVKLTEEDGRVGLNIKGKPGVLNNGRITIADEFDFSEVPESRKTAPGPVGRISLDGLSAKKARVTVNIYLDDEEAPCASFLLKRQMGKIGWNREGGFTTDVLGKNITGKHKVSVGFSIEAEDAGKDTTILLRSLTFCENSVPVMYFDIDETEGSIDAMNSSEDHTAECYGSVTLQVPEGYKGEFSDTILETKKNMKLDYVRGRGNSTWSTDKKPYKVKFDDPQDLLGMGQNNHWVLLADRYDNSLLRNRITYWIVRYLGMEYAIKCAPVEVVMNGRYFGSYLLSEQVRIDKNRVDINKLNEKVKDPDSLEITGGYLINLGGYDEESESTFATRSGLYCIERPDFSDYSSSADAKTAKTNQRDYIAGYFSKTESAIYGNDFKDEDGVPYSNYLDEDSAVDYWWIQEFAINGDAYLNGSSYLYKKRNTVGGDGEVQLGKLYWGPIWDFDYVAWGNPNCDPDTYEGFNNTSHAWMNRLRSGDEFCERLKARWSEPEDSADRQYSSHLSDAVTEVVKEGGVIDRYYDEFRVSQYYDYAKWGFYNEGAWEYSGQYEQQNPGGEQQDEQGEQQNPDGEQQGEQGEQQNPDGGQQGQQEEQQEESAQTYETEVEQLRSWIRLRQNWVSENLADIGVPTYTVRFLIDGKAYETRSYAEGEEFGNLPDVPARDGYTFTGWFDEDGFEVTEESSAYGDMDLFGKYVKTSRLKKAKDICFSSYDVYRWFYEGYMDDNVYEPDYTLMPEDCAPEKVMWSVDDPNTAAVNENGEVRFYRPGTVTVTGTLSSGRKNSYRLTFVGEDDDMYNVENVKLNRSKISLKTGAYTQLRADLTPKPNYSTALNWFTTDSDILSVDSFGILQAKKPGSTVVIALDPESSRYAVCKVTVKASRAYRIKTAKAAKVKSVKAKAVKAGKKRSVRVTWKKVSGVTGYYVLRSAKKNGKYKRVGTVKKAKTVRWTDKKVKSGKKYWYKVQPYTKIGKKIYKGKMSAAAKTSV